jgi:hypothetical protein
MRVNVSCHQGCLFDVENDPTEHHNIAAAQPALAHAMLSRLKALNSTIWRREMPPEDPACDVTAYGRYGGFLGPWIDLPRRRPEV